MNATNPSHSILASRASRTVRTMVATMSRAMRPTRATFAAPAALLCIALTPADGRSQGARGANPLLLEPDHPAWSEPAPDVFLAVFETSRGTFTIEVHRAWSPHGADHFHNLVRHGYYDGIRFNRVVAGFIAQWGLSGYPEVTRIWKGRPIPDDPVVESNVRGTIAFAMTGPDTRTTQVYINVVDNTRLDAQGFSPFGRVIEGLAVVDSLYSGYGENAGGGIRAGRQGPIETGGNHYLAREYPKLDSIVRAYIRRPDRGPMPPSFAHAQMLTLCHCDGGMDGDESEDEADPARGQTRRWKAVGR